MNILWAPTTITGVITAARRDFVYLKAIKDIGIAANNIKNGGAKRK